MTQFYPKGSHVIIFLGSGPIEHQAIGLPSMQFILLQFFFDIIKQKKKDLIIVFQK